MNVILHHTLRSIKGNKAQIAIIIFTIIIVAALLFVSISVSDVFYNLNINNQSRLVSDSDISISNEVFTVSRAQAYIDENPDKIASVEYFFELYGLLETPDSSKIVLMEATDLAALYERHPEKIKVYKQTAKYEYPPIWIGKDVATEMGITEGEIVDVYLQAYDEIQQFAVVCIMENEGFFTDSMVDNVLVDISAVNSRGLANQANIKLTDSKYFDEVVAELKNQMKNEALTIESSIDYERAEEVVTQNNKLLDIALALIMAMMFLILFTSYLVVVKNRINEMTIFKAAGATPAQTTLIMLLEVLLYGVVGSVIGVLIGRIGMGVAVRLILPNFPNAVSYPYWKYILAMGLGILFSVVSAIVPILRVSGKSIRQLTSGVVKDTKYMKPIYIIISSALILAMILVVVFVEEAVLYGSIVLILLFSFWIVCVVPYMIRFVSYLFKKIRKARLSSVSIKRNSAGHTLSILLGSVLTFSFFVYAVIGLIVSAITPYNARYSGDFVISNASDIDYSRLISDVRGQNGVEDVFYYKTCEFDGLSATGEEFEYQLIGINEADALLHCTEGLQQSDVEAFIGSATPIVINRDLSLRMRLKVGDSFCPSRHSVSATAQHVETLDTIFTVVAIEDSVTDNDRVAYVKAEQLLIKGKTVEAAEEKLIVTKGDGASVEPTFLELRATVDKYTGTFVLKFEDWVYATTKGLDGVASLFGILQIVVSLVASIGLINLTVATVYDRRKEFNIYRLSGMGPSEYGLLSLFEGVIVGISGASIGLIFSAIINGLMSPFGKIINKYVKISVFPIEILYVVLIGIAAYTLLYYLVMLSQRRLLQRSMTFNERE